ncbi:MAG: patatin-like phospholipase family protein [Pirellulaceae bacterium]|nr:patatin-like phospholipase family protein [Pirellulaceae bacterium]
MSAAPCNIWFGPGGLRGVFGAGVAQGLQDCLQQGQLATDQFTLYGSSIGCLNAAFLATGHTHRGLEIFQHETARLIRRENLWPTLAARIRNRLAGRETNQARAVPAIVDIDHVLAVMRRLTPEISNQLKQSALAVHAEVLERRTGAYQHLDLRQADEPLEVIRCALNCFPFYCGPTRGGLLDSAIRGPGFTRLLDDRREERLVVILNTRPQASFLRHWAADLAAAALAASPRISAYYACKQWRLRSAVRRARRQAGQVLLVCPPPPRPRATLGQLHADGIAAADSIREFIHNKTARGNPDAA